MTPLERAQKHLAEVERELVAATQENRLVEALIRAYVRASDEVEALTLWADEGVHRDQR